MQHELLPASPNELGCRPRLSGARNVRFRPFMMEDVTDSFYSEVFCFLQQLQKGFAPKSNNGHERGNTSPIC